MYVQIAKMARTITLALRLEWGVLSAAADADVEVELDVFVRMLGWPPANTTAKPGPGTVMSHPFEQSTWRLAGAQAAVLLTRFPSVTFAKVIPPQAMFVVSDMLSAPRYLTTRLFLVLEGNADCGTLNAIFWLSETDTLA